MLPSGNQAFKHTILWRSISYLNILSGCSPPALRQRAKPVEMTPHKMVKLLQKEELGKKLCEAVRLLQRDKNDKEIAQGRGDTGSLSWGVQMSVLKVQMTKRC